MKSTEELTHDVQELSRWIPAVREEVGRVVVGQKYLIDRLLLGLLANGHILLEGVPGLAKTLAVKTLAATIHTGFQRLQFSPRRTRWSRKALINCRKRNWIASC